MMSDVDAYYADIYAQGFGDKGQEFVVEMPRRYGTKGELCWWGI
jgi:hypothetical protein